MNEYLDSIDNLDETITTILDVTRLLAFDGFDLDKLISNNCNILRYQSRESLSSKVVN